MPELKVPEDKFKAIQRALGHNSAPSPTETYKQMTDRIQQLLSETVGRNPAVSNYAIHMMDQKKSKTMDELYNKLTNLPNTLVFQAHGTSNSEIPPAIPNSFPNNPKGYHGFYPNESQTNDLAMAIKARRDLIQKNPDVAGIADTLGGTSMATIAKSLAGATNDIKRAVLLNCYRGGYNPDEIKQYFPNVEQIITSAPESSTSTAHAIPMFQKTEDPYFRAHPSPTNYPGEDFILRNYSGGKTNPIYKISDWIKDLPAGMEPFGHIKQ